MNSDRQKTYTGISFHDLRCTEIEKKSSLITELFNILRKCLATY